MLCERPEDGEESLLCALGDGRKEGKHALAVHGNKTTIIS
jgi:hypothetical protein